MEPGKEDTSWGRFHSRELCRVLVDVLRGTNAQAVCLELVNAAIMRKRAGIHEVSLEEQTRLFENRPNFLRAYTQLPRVIKPDALSQGVLALEVMHPHDLAAILGVLVQLGYASNVQLETTLNQLKSMDAIIEDEIKAIVEESMNSNRVDVILLSKYCHGSMLEQSPTVKFKDSRNSYFLSGSQGGFAPNLYCYSEIAGFRLQYSDDYKEMTGYTMTPQYHSIAEENPRDEFCFRCAYASRMTEAQLLSTEKEWEDYYNASVRCSKDRLVPLPECFDRGYAAVALNSGINLFEARSMLHYLQLEREHLKKKHTALRITIRDISAWREGPRLYVKWFMWHELSDKFHYDIHVIRVPSDITEVRSVPQHCGHFVPLSLMKITLPLSRKCEICNDSRNSWMCLTCTRVFCGRSIRGHMVQHSKEHKHYVVLGCDEHYAWCNECMRRV